MKNPMLTPYGHYYEKLNIQKWLSSHDTDPLTRQHLTFSMLIEDIEFKEKIEKYKKKYNL